MVVPSRHRDEEERVIRTKKNGKSRFCVNYTALNRVTKAEKWPLPIMEEIFDDLDGSRVFTTLDLFSWYRQVWMASWCKEQKKFVCQHGTFQYDVMHAVLPHEWSFNISEDHGWRIQEPAIRPSIPL